MAKKPENVNKLFSGLIPVATAKQKQEAARNLSKIDTEKGRDYLGPHGHWNHFYAEMVR